MIHIDFHPPERLLRQFGWISLFGFPLIGWLVLHLAWGTSPGVAWILTGVGAVIFVLSRFSPGAVRPVYVGLMVVAWPIGMAVSTLALGLIYYLMFTPVAFLFRVMGRDPLHRKIEPEAPTYWVPRKSSLPPARYLRMY